MRDMINPRVDLAFKKIFGVEENKDLTMSLINAVVAPEDQVSEITLLNPYNPKNFANFLGASAKYTSNRLPEHR